MSVTAKLPDGRILEFPDGTPPDVVQASVKRVLAGEIGLPDKGEQQPAQEEQGQGGYFRGLLQNIGQGSPFGLSDEAVGGIVAGMAKMQGDERPFADIYKEVRDAERMGQQQFCQEFDKFISFHFVFNYSK